MTEMAQIDQKYRKPDDTKVKCNDKIRHNGDTVGESNGKIGYSKGITWCKDNTKGTMITQKAQKRHYDDIRAWWCYERTKLWSKKIGWYNKTLWWHSSHVFESIGNNDDSVYSYSNIGIIFA